MNIYPEWWDTSVTVYNRQEDPQTNIISWYKHIIDGAFWKYVKDKVTIGETVLETNKIICRIRKDANYMDKEEWLKLPNDIKPNYFTLSQGDIIVKGSVEDEINEYQTGHRSTDIIAKYKKLQGCMEISLASNNTGAGRGQEHYLAEGI